MAESPTELIDRWNRGDRGAMNELVAMMQAELRQIASAHFRRERPGQTLQPTAVVNEAYLRLIGYEQLRYNGRAHFLAMASRVMRQLLVDHARRRRAARRGGSGVRTELRALRTPTPRLADALVINEALERLAALDRRQAEIVEMKCFGGLTNDEIAAAAGVSVGTIKREWATAKLWLARELSDAPVRDS